MSSGATGVSFPLASASFNAITLGNQNLSLLTDWNAAPKIYVDNRFNTLVGAAPAALDTLSEIATALKNDPNLGTNLTNQIASVRTDMQNADLVLQTNINAANTARVSAVTTLQNNINNLSASVDSKTLNLQTNIDNERNARTAAITSLDNAKYNKAGGDITGFATAKAGLRVDINTNSFLYIGTRWRINASNDGKTLMFEYLSDLAVPTSWVTAVPFIQP